MSMTGAATRGTREAARPTSGSIGDDGAAGMTLRQ
jgi:hypothetical protein